MSSHAADQLILRYVHAVGRQLPRAQRADVMAELQSLLHESLEARAAEAGRPVEEALAVDTLREFGPPDMVAHRYMPYGPYLIGPRLYPTFVAVVKTFAIVLGILALLGWTLTVSTSPASEMPARLWASVVSPLQWGLIQLAIIVVVFAIIERVMSQRQMTESPTAKAAKPEWNPRDLPVIDNTNEADRGGLIGSLIVHVVLIAIILGFPTLPALLSPSFYSLVPWWASTAVLDLLVLGVVLVQGRWTRLMRLAEFGASLFGLFVVIQTFRAEPLLLLPGADLGVKIGIGIAFVIALIETGIQLVRLVARPVPADVNMGQHVRAL